MARGKYAARAALRREDAEVRSDLEGYQHHVRRLTAENARLRADLGQARRDHAAEVRALRAQRDEGLSPEVEALREQLREERDLADKACADAQRIKEMWERSYDRVMALARSLGLTPREASEVAFWTAAEDPNDGRGIDFDGTGKYGVSPIQARAIDVARRRRHPGDAALAVIERAGEALNEIRKDRSRESLRNRGKR
jgi:hypothetical protein